jgi:hypothetical protein
MVNGLSERQIPWSERSERQTDKTKKAAECAGKARWPLSRSGDLFDRTHKIKKNSKTAKRSLLQ